jgi:hypothetical protein
VGAHAAQTSTQRPTYPVSSYYEQARQQAWQEPAHRIEYAPIPDDQFESSAPAVSEAHESVAVPVPVVVEHIPEVASGSTMDAFTTAQETHTETHEMREHGTAHGATAEPGPELVPVRASVFDDDFFRKPKDEGVAKPGEEAGSKPWPDARVPSFAGYAGEAPADNDELDIPAFLRRKQ